MNSSRLNSSFLILFTCLRVVYEAGIFLSSGRFHSRNSNVKFFLFERDFDLCFVLQLRLLIFHPPPKVKLATSNWTEENITPCLCQRPNRDWLQWTLVITTTLQSAYWWLLYPTLYHVLHTVLAWGKFQDETWNFMSKLTTKALNTIKSKLMVDTKFYVLHIKIFIMKLAD